MCMKKSVEFSLHAKLFWCIRDKGHVREETNKQIIKQLFDLLQLGGYYEEAKIMLLLHDDFSKLVIRIVSARPFSWHGKNFSLLIWVWYMFRRPYLLCQMWRVIPLGLFLPECRPRFLWGCSPSGCAGSCRQWRRGRSWGRWLSSRPLTPTRPTAAMMIYLFGPWCRNSSIPSSWPHVSTTPSNTTHRKMPPQKSLRGSRSFFQIGPKV